MSLLCIAAFSLVASRFRPTMTSADFCGVLPPCYYGVPLLLRSSRLPPTATPQTSQGKIIRFPFMSPPHLRSDIPYSIGLLFLLQHHPCQNASM